MGTEYKTPSLMEPAAGFEPATYRLLGEFDIFLTKAIWAPAVLSRQNLYLSALTYLFLTYKYQLKSSERPTAARFLSSC